MERWRDGKSKEAWQTLASDQQNKVLMLQITHLQVQILGGGVEELEERMNTSHLSCPRLCVRNRFRSSNTIAINIKTTSLPATVISDSRSASISAQCVGQISFYSTVAKFKFIRRHRIYNKPKQWAISADVATAIRLPYGNVSEQSQTIMRFIFHSHPSERPDLHKDTKGKIPTSDTQVA